MAVERRVARGYYGSILVQSLHRRRGGDQGHRRKPLKPHVEFASGHQRKLLLRPSGHDLKLLIAAEVIDGSQRHLIPKGPACKTHEARRTEGWGMMFHGGTCWSFHIFKWVSEAGRVHRGQAQFQCF